MVPAAIPVSDADRISALAAGLDKSEAELISTITYINSDRPGRSAAPYSLFVLTGLGIIPRCAFYPIQTILAERVKKIKRTLFRELKIDDLRYIDSVNLDLLGQVLQTNAIKIYFEELHIGHRRTGQGTINLIAHNFAELKIELFGKPSLLKKKTQTKKFVSSEKQRAKSITIFSRILRPEVFVEYNPQGRPKEQSVLRWEYQKLRKTLERNGIDGRIAAQIIQPSPRKGCANKALVAVVGD